MSIEKQFDWQRSAPRRGASRSAPVGPPGPAASSRPARQATADYLAIASHELRTPLTAIIGFAEMMCQEVKGPLPQDSYLDYARCIRDSGLHLASTIEAILDLSQIDSDDLVLQESPVSLSDLAAWALGCLAETAEAEQVALTSRIAAGTPEIFGDERLIRAALFHLLSKAVKVAPGGGEVLIAAERRRAQGLCITISADGDTAERPALSQARKPCQQAAPSRTAKGRLGGIALTLSESYLRLHQGGLSVSQERRCGTVITVLFPEERVLSA